ncbi:MAG: AraC family transcriptional regulator [Lentisphaerae bacterium]|nr:MAG: AraC family transcriptional regulator [Lentisphaerota bacterium]
MRLKIPECWSTFRTLGDDPRRREIGCGFIHKRHPYGVELQVLFRERYGALLVLQGTGSYRDETGIEVPLTRPGDMIQRLPSRRHWTPVNAGDDWYECFVTLGVDFYNAIVTLGCIDPDRPVIHSYVNQSIVDEFDSLRHHLRSAPDTELTAILLQIQNLLLRLQHDNKNCNQDRQLAEACRLLADLPSQRIHMEDVAKKLGMGYESFRKWFRTNMGMPPGEYRIRRRIDTAKTRLMQGAPVKEVADELGYADAFTFSRQFHRVTGMTPTAFRRMH